MIKHREVIGKVKLTVEGYHIADWCVVIIHNDGWRILHHFFRATTHDQCYVGRYQFFVEYFWTIHSLIQCYGRCYAVQNDHLFVYVMTGRLTSLTSRAESWKWRFLSSALQRAEDILIKSGAVAPESTTTVNRSSPRFANKKQSDVAVNATNMSKQSHWGPTSNHGPVASFEWVTNGMNKQVRWKFASTVSKSFNCRVHIEQSLLALSSITHVSSWIWNCSQPGLEQTTSPKLDHLAVQAVSQVKLTSGQLKSVNINLGTFGFGITMFRGQVVFF